eukprot:467711_1
MSHTQNESQYTQKRITDWNNQDLLNWIKTIGLQTQWQEIMIQLITSTNCTGKDWIDIKNFKQLAQKFNITQTMLANRVFREFKKAKQNQPTNNTNTNTTVTKNITTPNKLKMKTTPHKQNITAWKNKNIKDWTNKDLLNWIKTIGLQIQWQEIICQTITTTNCTGKDWLTVKNFKELSKKFNITQ